MFALIVLGRYMVFSIFYSDATDKIVKPIQNTWILSNLDFSIDLLMFELNTDSSGV